MKNQWKLVVIVFALITAYIVLGNADSIFVARGGAHDGGVDVSPKATHVDAGAKADGGHDGSAKNNDGGATGAKLSAKPSAKDSGSESHGG